MIIQCVLLCLTQTPVPAPGQDTPPPDPVPIEEVEDVEKVEEVHGAEETEQSAGDEAGEQGQDPVEVAEQGPAEEPAPEAEQVQPAEQTPEQAPEDPVAEELGPVESGPVESGPVESGPEQVAAEAQAPEEPAAGEPTAEVAAAPTAADAELQAAMGAAAQKLADKAGVLKAAREQPAGDSPAAGPVDDWQTLNGVELIINSDCITRPDFQRARQADPRPVNSEAEQSQRAQEIATALITKHLKTQAGKDKGFDPPMIERFVADQVEDTKRRAGSASRLADQLQDSHVDATDYHESIESKVLRDLWTGAVIGRYPGPGGRMFQDRYVRPRRLKFEFERQEGRRDLPASVTVQELVCHPTYTGSVQAARDLAESLLEQIREGGDFGELAVANKAAPEDTQGMHDPMDEERLLTIPEVGEFIAGAQPGDISEVLPVREDGVLRAWRVLKLIARTEATTAAFDDPEVQKLLHDRYMQVLDRGREEEALGLLLDAAYVWPPRFFGRVEKEAAGPIPSGDVQGPKEVQ